MSMEEALEKENITYNKFKTDQEDDKPSKFMLVNYYIQLFLNFSFNKIRK